MQQVLRLEDERTAMMLRGGWMRYVNFQVNSSEVLPSTKV
jgi:hypothetical protein